MKTKPKFVVGIDEVGRGPLAGPVLVCAVLMTQQIYIKIKRTSELDKLRDSKKLTHARREDWFKKIKKWQKSGLLDFSCVSMSSRIIDKKGLSFVLKECVKKTLINLNVPDDSIILLDGSLSAPQNFHNQKVIIKGDEKEPIISLASIAAKVTRDKYMSKIDLNYPQYDFSTNKGYGTEKHCQAIRKHGLSKEHRISFCDKILRV